MIQYYEQNSLKYYLIYYYVKFLQKEIITMIHHQMKYIQYSILYNNWSFMKEYRINGHLIESIMNQKRRQNYKYSKKTQDTMMNTNDISNMITECHTCKFISKQRIWNHEMI